MYSQIKGIKMKKNLTSKELSILSMFISIRDIADSLIKLDEKSCSGSCVVETLNSLSPNIKREEVMNCINSLLDAWAFLGNSGIPKLIEELEGVKVSLPLNKKGMILVKKGIGLETV